METSTFLLRSTGAALLVLGSAVAANAQVAGSVPGGVSGGVQGGVVSGMQGEVHARVLADVDRLLQGVRPLMSLDTRVEYALERLRMDHLALPGLENLRLLPFEPQSGGGKDERTYQEGMKAISEGRYERAATLFEQVVQAGTARADAALYYKAWALNKQGQRAEALSAVSEFTKRHPESRWLNDVKALEIEIRQAAGQKVSPETQVDDELKLMAINALMNSDAESAVPMLEKMLQGAHSPKLKERALFVLSQSSAPRARQILAAIAKGTSNPDQQMKAINYLGVHGSRENRALLSEIYTASTDIPVKKAILRSFMVSGDRERVLAAARSEQTPELRAEAVRQLGVMGGHAELWDLYQKETSVDVKKQILQAMFVGGDATRLVELARTEKDPELRRRAVRNLGLIGADKTGAALLSLYQNDKDPAIRKEVVNGLFIQGNDTALIDLARKETDPAMKKDIVNRLSHMNTKASLAYMLEILNK